MICFTTGTYCSPRSPPFEPTSETGSTPTAVIAGATVNRSLRPRSERSPSQPSRPFRFVLPTPGAEPVSGWRPPLYPVPWAVSAYDHFYFARPIAADNVNWPLAEYRYGGVFFAPNIVHTGVDIDADEGTPILAAGPGTVVSADWGLFTRSARKSSAILMDRRSSSAMTLAIRIRHFIRSMLT